jgi:hypothetical protein
MAPDEFKKIVMRYELPLPWLARHIGNHVSERSFRYWVNGRPGVSVTVPDDVVKRLQRLNEHIAKALTS